MHLSDCVQAFDAVRIDFYVKHNLTDKSIFTELVMRQSNLEYYSRRLGQARAAASAATCDAAKAAHRLFASAYAERLVETGKVSVIVE